MEKEKNWEERFDKKFGNKMSGKNLPGYIDGLDNELSENIKSFILSEMTALMNECVESIKKEIEKHSIIIEKCDTIIQNEDFNEEMTERETWKMLKRNVAKRDVLQDQYQELKNISAKHGFKI
jgi:hypothetical protein